MSPKAKLFFRASIGVLFFGGYPTFVALKGSQKEASIFWDP